MMIYVIFNPRKFKREDIIVDLKSERYPHRFFIAERQPVDKKRKGISLADEVWCFGNCEQMHDYQLAKEMGKDIWQMG